MFEPDIIVTSSRASAPILVVEVKWHLRDPAEAERQLKQYMVESGCPTGLLITPSRIQIYRDRFRAEGADAIELVGQYEVSGTLGDSWRESTEHLNSGERGIAFEREVQAWLETLLSGTENLSSPLREAIDEYVLPLLAQGEVRAARPRSRPRTISAP